MILPEETTRSNGIHCSSTSEFDTACHRTLLSKIVRLFVGSGNSALVVLISTRENGTRFRSVKSLERVYPYGRPTGLQVDTLTI